MEYYTFTVKPDRRWPPDENGEIPLVAFGNWGKFVGWWEYSHFAEWLQNRCGSIVQKNEATGEMNVLALLTKTEAKKGFRKQSTRLTNSSQNPHIE